METTMPYHRRHPVAFASLLVVVLALVMRYAAEAGADEWAGYEKLTRDQVTSALGSGSAPANLYAKNLSNLDLSGVDFKGANLSAAVLNGSNLSKAILAGCNLTVSFLAHANLSAADLRRAVLF